MAIGDLRMGSGKNYVKTERLLDAGLVTNGIMHLPLPPPRPPLLSIYYHVKVYIGGAVDDANRMVAAGKAKAEDFKFYLHLCGWAPGQLEAEIERGVWFAAACSANVSFTHYHVLFHKPRSLIVFLQL